METHHTPLNPITHPPVFRRKALCLAVMAATVGPVSQAMPALAVIELSSLDGSNGFAVNGIKSMNLSGVSVSSAGDINVDGIDDFIIGAFGAGPNASNAGQSYVVFGGSGVGTRW